jgi:hypothetical protein
MELIDYLNKHFFTRAQLLERAGIGAEQLEQWQRGRMMPLPSYRLRLDASCISFFGEHREPMVADYYPKGSLAWIGGLRALRDENAASRLFARRYRERLAQLAAAGIAPNVNELGSDAHIDSEWNHFLAGTYGVCTVSGLPEDIAAKEAAVVLIRAILTDERVLTASERERLRGAVDLLDSVSAPFAPHEVARSSRRRYVDDVRAKYGLPSA